MSDGVDPSIRIFEVAGRRDCMLQEDCAYDALKAAGSPYAEIYKRGWDESEARFGCFIGWSPTPSRAA